MNNIKIRDILDFADQEGFQYSFVGNEQAEVSGFSSLLNYKTGSLTWIKKEEIYDMAKRPTNIALAIVQTGVETEISNYIETSDSKALFFGILNRFWGNNITPGRIGAGTIISEEADVDDTASIGCNCSIIGNVTIGAGTIVENNVVIQGKVSIGDRCHIQSGAVIGIDGYGYSQDPSTKKKKMVLHFGGVQIGHDVFVGSHVNIARGTIDDTIIGNGVKIAPSTHIGHNNIVGDDTAIICSTMYGSIKTGRGSYITASTLANQITIGDNTVIGMGSVVTKPVPDNVIAYGVPAVVKKENDSNL